MALSRRKPAEPVRIQIKKNDQVRVISGRDGKNGRVLSVDPQTNKALVEHIAMIKRHTRPNPGKQIQRRHRRAREPHRGFEPDDFVPAVRAGAHRASYGKSAGR
jgi:hypothetical protein